MPTMGQRTNAHRTYVENLMMRFSRKQFTTKFQPLEKGILTGCTISVILFILGMNVIIKGASKEWRGPMLQGKMLPTCFIDDWTVTTHSTIGTRNVVKKLEELKSWTRMKFKVAKSRSLVLVKGTIYTVVIEHLFWMEKEFLQYVRSPLSTWKRFMTAA